MTTVDITTAPERAAHRVVEFKPSLLQSSEHDLCPGCGHPVAWRLVLDALVELELERRTILIAGHGCYTQMMRISDIDSLQCLHGRAPAVATGVKRMKPEAAVVTLQGDGDMVSEGLHEVLHAAARGEKVTALLFNNGVFGDTGGHMTATTVIGQRTKTSLEGREAEEHGYPIDIARAPDPDRGRSLCRPRCGQHAGDDRPHEADDPACPRIADGRGRVHLRRGAHHVPDRVVRPHAGRTRVPRGLHDGDLRDRRAQSPRLTKAGDRRRATAFSAPTSQPEGRASLGASWLLGPGRER